MDDVRVLVAAGDAFWHRSIMRGFSAVALERGWTVVRYPSEENLEWFIREWQAAAVVLAHPPASLGWKGTATVATLALNWLPEDPAMPALGIHDPHAGELAAEHLLGRGFRQFSSLLYAGGTFAVERVSRFRDVVRAAGGEFHRTGLYDLDDMGRPVAWERPDLIPSWLKGLPKPCGIFCACDTWARTVACYCRVSGIRVPEDVAIVGVDNDPSECEQTLPHLSSVSIPWQEMGREAAMLVARSLRGKDVTGRRVLVKPTGVIARRSSDTAAISDTEVAEAVAWIRLHADRPIQVKDVLRAIPTYRHRLEKRFQAVLGRTVMQEVRQAHVETAKRLLEMTDLAMPEVAQRSGFSSASMLSVTFRRETGQTPGDYRRAVHAGREDR